MKPSMEQIEAWLAQAGAQPLGRPVTSLAELAYAAGRKAGMEEAAKIAQSEGKHWDYIGYDRCADGAYHAEGAIRAAMEADNVS